LKRGYNVVANSRHISDSKAFEKSAQIELVDGDIGQVDTAKRIVSAALSKFGSIDALVNNAGIFFPKPFVDYTQEDFKRLLSTNVEGFLYITQLAIKQMLEQGTAGSVVSITTSMAEHPIAGMPAAVPMLTKGGLNSASLSLAMEYAKAGIRVNVVAPGIIDTPMHKNNPKDFLRTLSPLGTISDPKELAEAVLFLTEASTITGEILHVDGGSHLGRW
jgi:NAD(P)-dependent dehydrogenase (short-subunit alcohol dehydrogenase family)